MAAGNGLTIRISARGAEAFKPALSALEQASRNRRAPSLPSWLAFASGLALGLAAGLVFGFELAAKAAGF